MPRKFNCQLCGRSFTSVTSEFEHFKREHVGKLTEESYRYLCQLGVPAEKITDFCRANVVQLDARIANRRAQLSLEVFA